MTTRELLRSLPVFEDAADLRFPDPAVAPADPADLFLTWLGDALAAGQIEPHAMTLSTTDESGAPDARVLILKDLDQDGWWFATSAMSAKAQQLGHAAVAALTFYWPAVARQVRIRGTVHVGTPDQGAADFAARGAVSRSVALSSLQSRPLASREECMSAVADARLRLETNPDLSADSWQVCAVRAHSVEFWQGDPGRIHHRLRYRRRAEGSWSTDLLWP